MRPQVLFSLLNFWTVNSPRGPYTNTMIEELLHGVCRWTWLVLKLYDMLEQRTDGDPI